MRLNQQSAFSQIMVIDDCHKSAFFRITTFHSLSIFEAVGTFQELKPLVFFKQLRKRLRVPPESRMGETFFSSFYVNDCENLWVMVLPKLKLHWMLLLRLMEKTMFFGEGEKAI